MSSTESPAPHPPAAGAAATAATPEKSTAAAAEPEKKEENQVVVALTQVSDVMNKVVGVPDWIALHPLLANYAAEGIGTFIFALTVALVGINNPHQPDRPETNITALPIAFMLMCMVFTFGYISGGHFNPAVTFAVLIAKRDNVFKALLYMACQTGAAFGAGVVALIIVGDKGIIVPNVKDNDSTFIRKGLFAELIYTFALATVVLHVACSKQRANFFYGFAIGMTVCAGICAVGGVSGGAFNPAIATGLQFAVCLNGNCNFILHTWLYWLSPMIGAGLAALLFLIMDTGDRHDDATAKTATEMQPSPA